MTEGTGPGRARRGPDALVGAHMSTAGGLATAVERALAAGCRCLQVFTKNSNQWQGKLLSREESAAFLSASAKAGLAPLVSHAAYLINLASSDPAIRERSVLAIQDEISRCAAAGIPYLVLHPGSHGGDGIETGLDRIARGLDKALAEAEAGVEVLLETAAGQGASLGTTFAELRQIRERSDLSSRIGFCFDTCHVHAAGYDLVSSDGWRETLDEAEREIGLSRIRVIHANDSKKERGCRVDRHERIGHGALGKASFSHLMTEPAFADVPKILETPKDEAGKWDREGLALLRKLARP
ncbi:MAG: putative endonuclease 4 [Thermoanaerobaculia bacterium]|nr:putative endonuclease 4 [Thermoanaerobaculia bacterium]